MSRPAQPARHLGDRQGSQVADVLTVLCGLEKVWKAAESHGGRRCQKDPKSTCLQKRPFLDVLDSTLRDKVHTAGLRKLVFQRSMFQVPYLHIKLP